MDRYCPSVYVAVVVAVFAIVACPDAQAARDGLAQIEKAQRLLCNATTKRSRRDLVYSRDFSAPISGILPDVNGFWRDVDIEADTYLRSYAAARENEPATAEQGLNTLISQKICAPTEIQRDLDHSIKILTSGGRQFRPENPAVCFVSLDDYKLMTKRRNPVSSSDLAKNVVDRCSAFYREGYFASEFSDLTARTLVVEAEMLAAKERNEAAALAFAIAKEERELVRQREEEKRNQAAARERQRQARIAAEKESRDRAIQAAALQAAAERNERYAQYNNATGNQVIWGDTREKPARTPRSDELEALNRINSEFQKRISIPDSSLAFEAPVRGEFEKSADYQRRVSGLKRQHAAKVAQQKSELSAGRTDVFESVWNEMLGTPSLADLEYDADAEQFRAKVVSSAGLSIPVYLAVPIGVAPDLKEALQGMRPWVVGSLANGRLDLQGVFFQGGKKTIDAKLGIKTINFVFDESQLSTYQAALAREQQAQDEASRKRRAEMARRYPYIVNFYCSQNGGSLPLSACLRRDGELHVITSEGNEVFGLRDALSSTSFSANLTERFKVGAIVGSDSRYGVIEIMVTNRVSGKLVKRLMASGGGDYAIWEH